MKFLFRGHKLKEKRAAVLRKILFIPLLFLLLFWKPLLEEGAGLAARAYLQLSRGWNFTYREVAWKKGGLHFFALSLVDKDAFSMEAEMLTLFPSQKHLVLTQPKITLFAPFSWKREGASPRRWTFAVHDGILQGEGIETARFRAMRDFPQQVGRIWLDFAHANLELELFREASLLRLDARFSSFNPLYLRKLLGSSDLEGLFSGRAHLVFKGGRIVHLSTALHGKNVQWREMVKHLEGDLSLEGPGEWKHFFKEGRAHLCIEGGELLFPKSSVKKVGGECNFFGGMGAKWELQGEANALDQDFIVALEGKGFFQNCKEQWLDASLRMGSSSLTLRGLKGEEWNWEGCCEKMEAEQVGLLQPLFSLFEPRLSEWEMAQGTIDFRVAAKGAPLAPAQWDLSHFTATHFLGRCRETKIKVKDLQGAYSTLSKKGYFSFEEGVLQTELLSDKELIASGEGEIDEALLRHFHLKGQFDEFDWEAIAIGSLKSFRTEVKARGPWEGRAFFDGEWDGEKFLFSVEEGEIEGFQFAGGGWLDRLGTFSVWSDRFQGPLTTLCKLCQEELPLSGEVRSLEGKGFRVWGDGGHWDWSLQAKIQNGSMPLLSKLSLAEIEMEVEAGSEGLSCYEVRGFLDCGERIPLYCPLVRERGTFDLRLEGPYYDLVRLVGNTSSGSVQFDPDKSHLLNRHFTSEKCFVREGHLESLQLNCTLSSDLFKETLLFFAPLSKQLALASLEGTAAVQFSYQRDSCSRVEISGIDLLWEKKPLPLRLAATEQEGKWMVEELQCADFFATAEIEEAHLLTKGRASCDGLEFDFEGRIDPSSRTELHLTAVKLDLGSIQPLVASLGLSLREIEGLLEGTGHLIWDKQFELDFDFAQTSSLKVGAFSIENRGPLHIYYAPAEGILFRGLDLELFNSASSFSCKIDLLHYDVQRSFWVLNHSRIHLPGELFSTLKNISPFLTEFDPTHDIDFLADIECSSDFVHVRCTMQEAFIPFEGTLRSMQNVSLLMKEDRCDLAFSYLHQGLPLRVGLKMHLAPILEGRLILEEEGSSLEPEETPLQIDWIYQDGLCIQAVEGSFCGIEVLFHAEAEGSLIGSARFHCLPLAQIVPPRIAELFSDLKMGSGYEIKGRLLLTTPEGPLFQGLLSGKQVELFGFQLRTLLAKIELSAERVKISDLKISDSAGIMKIEEILAVGNRGPWTISIPHITILEFRPSLLQKVGGPPGKISPLVIRELKLEDFKGLLEESRTYTAQGELHFINSYKREYTLFDIPSDVLSRIVGLDFEILTPVCGTLKYELKDRHFHLTELKNSFSEGKRTEFFLASDVWIPTMDLDGNLHILIRMKQFVLFKFTESFLISIEGKLDDPKFHLQKKSRFLGL